MRRDMGVTNATCRWLACPPGRAGVRPVVHSEQRRSMVMCAPGGLVNAQRAACSSRTALTVGQFALTSSSLIIASDVAAAATASTHPTHEAWTSPS